MKHTVRSGESLFKIAMHHNTTVQHLIDMNPRLRRRPDVIYPGEKIKVPAHHMNHSNH